VHLPHLSPTNASDQKSILAKLVAPEWGNKLVTEITPYDVEKLLNKVAAGRARPSKAKPNNRARKLQRAKPTPVRANRTGEVLRKMFTYAVGWGWRDDNPASSFRRRIENARERFLSHEEIRKLAEALVAAEDRRAADIIRLPALNDTLQAGHGPCPALTTLPQAYLIVTTFRGAQASSWFTNALAVLRMLNPCFVMMPGVNPKSMAPHEQVLFQELSALWNIACVQISIELIHRMYCSAFCKFAAINFLHEAIRVPEHLARGPDRIGVMTADKIGDQGADQMTMHLEVFFETPVDEALVQHSVRERQQVCAMQLIDPLIDTRCWPVAQYMRIKEGAGAGPEGTDFLAAMCF